MKTRDITTKYNLDLTEFDNWLLTSGIPHKKGMFGGFEILSTENIDEIVSNYKKSLTEKLEQKRQAEEKAKKAAADRQSEILRIEAEKEAAAKEKQKALASMLITSGFSFDGHKITKYSGYISGDDVIEIDRPTRGWLGGMSNNVGQDLMNSLAKMRRNSIAELKEAAYALGCNAVIGVDFDYLTLDPETVTPQGGTLYLPFLFGVTANGNAVIIENEEE